MAYMPTLTETATSRSITDTFLGYNHNLKIGDGEFYDTGNLTSQFYPLLSNRKPRGYVKSFKSFQGITSLNGKLAYVDKGTLYYNHVATPLTGLSTGEKQLVPFGAYICVFPDNMYYSTVDASDYGSMTHGINISNASLEFRMCDSEGVEYAEATESETAPVSPADGDLWIDTANETLNMYSVSSAMWIAITQVFTKVILPSQAIGSRPIDLFSEYDGVMISGLAEDGLNGSKVLYGVGTNYIVIVGIVKNNFTQIRATVSIKTWVPEMNYVVESQNRLWGCYYGADDNGGTINEIYCCVLGDFKNWNRFLGISTDSYVASVGTDGPWTGAVDYLGYPTFFKENYIHRVTVSSTGAHQIESLPCRGVQKGSGKSLSIINEYLFYKGTENICSYQGGFPSTISDQLGDVKYYEAVAGGIGNRLYISMHDADGIYSLFVADVSKGFWMREDDLQVVAFCRCNDELYAVSAAGKLYAMLGSDGTQEETNDIEWFAETGILYYEYPDKKYISRFNIRMKMEKDAKLDIEIQYDSDGVWHKFPTIYFSGIGTVNVPIRPRRCDHMRVRLSGRGDLKIFSIARILEIGSDI